MTSSQIDDLFEQLYGFKPTKKGGSYELLVAAAIKLTNENSNISINQFVDGMYSGEKYQIDAVIDPLNVGVEAKDYTERGSKVGRPDITKLAGALQDLPFESGIVASATEFTQPAKAYANATESIPTSKPIKLLHVRPSTAKDIEGRITVVETNLKALQPNFQKAIFEVDITEEGRAVLAKLGLQADKLTQRVDAFYNIQTQPVLTMFEFTKNATIDPNTNTGINHWIPTEPTFILVNDQLIEFSELRYSIPYVLIEYQFKIGPAGTAQLLIKSEDGSIDKILTDIDLKRIDFGSLNTNAD